MRFWKASERWRRAEYAMGCRATEAIWEGKTQDEYVAMMLALRPRLKKAVWTPRLEQVYDSTLRSFQQSMGACGTCGKDCNGFNSHRYIGKFPYHDTCIAEDEIRDDAKRRGILVDDLIQLWKEGRLRAVRGEKHWEITFHPVEEAK